MKRKIAESKTTRLWCPKSAGCFLWFIYFHSSAILTANSFSRLSTKLSAAKPGRILLWMGQDMSSPNQTRFYYTCMYLEVRDLQLLPVLPMFYQYPSVLQMSHRVIEHAVVQVSSISAVSCVKLSMCQACSGSVLSRTDVLLSWIRPAWD